jgi:leader peptidase (prepilin peptidase)/N-methyltransferase
VPLVSWLALRGRCRTCHAWIGWRHPLVELAVGVLWAYSAYFFFRALSGSGMMPTNIYVPLIFAIGQMILSWLLVALATLDAENFWLPNWLTLPGAVLGFIFYFLRIKMSSDNVLNYYGTLSLQKRFLFEATFKWLLGILAAAGLILLIRWVYWLIRHREGIGLGDAKLMALLAAWLGLPQALLAFGMGATLGAVAAVVLLALPSKRLDLRAWAAQKLPLGTFLCIGGIISSLWGGQLIDAYLRWAGF